MLVFLKKRQENGVDGKTYSSNNIMRLREPLYFGAEGSFCGQEKEHVKVGHVKTDRAHFRWHQHTQR